MARRGNEPATVPVRPHFATGAVVLALAPVVGLLWTLGVPRVGPNLPVLLALMGLTLVAQGIAFWYLPSFAKRAVVPSGIAAYAGPVLLGFATLAAVVGPASGIVELLRPATVTLGLALVLFPFTLVASVVAGPRWRQGTPFWRAGGAHERGDRAALAAFAAACAWLAAAGGLLLYAPRPGIGAVTLAWLLGLALFAAGALAHLLPRGAGAPLAWAGFAAGLVAANLGGALTFWATLAPDPVDPVYAALLLGGGLGLVASALLPRRGAKPAGPRARDARPLLAAALAPLAAGILLLVAGFGVDAAWTTLAAYALLVAVALAYAGLTLLTLPVLFNQRPAARFVLPCAVAFPAGLALVLLSAVSPVPRALGALVLGAAVALWLATLAPLRKPRRECPPDGE